MMDTSDVVIAIVSALGGGGITSILTTVLSRKKFKAEADSIRVQNEETEMEYIKKSFKELNEETKAQFNEFKDTAKATIDELKEEIKELRESNEKLHYESTSLKSSVDDLKQKLTSLMNWVTGDDKRYRDWLEKTLQDLDPSIEFPSHTDPPNVFPKDTDKEETE